MQEWLNWPAWKASKRQKRFRGSNPLLSAKETRYKQQIDFCFLSRSFFIKYIEIEFIRISVCFIKNIFQDERFAVYILFPLHGRRRQAGEHGTQAKRVP